MKASRDKAISVLLNLATETLEKQKKYAGTEKERQRNKEDMKQLLTVVTTVKKKVSRGSGEKKRGTPTYDLKLASPRNPSVGTSKSDLSVKPTELSDGVTLSDTQAAIIADMTVES